MMNHAFDGTDLIRMLQFLTHFVKKAKTLTISEE